MAWYDYVPGASNVAGIVKGDARQALLGAGGEILESAGILPGEVEQPTRPDSSQYFGTAEESAAEQLRRARALEEAAAGFRTQAQVREPGAITAERPTPLSEQIRQGQAFLADAGRVSAPGALSAPQLAELERVQPRIAGEIERAQAAEIGPARLTEKTGVLREGGTEASTALARAAAMGEVPSKAEALLRSGLDTAAKKQLSLAASAKGSERRGAKRAALLAIGEQGADVAQQAAALRAEEMARGRAEFSQAEQTTARLRQDAANLEAQIDAAAKRGDADAVNRLKAQQAEINTRISQVNAQMATGRQSETADAFNRAAAINAAAANQRAQDIAGMTLRVGEGNLDRSFRAEESNVEREARTAEANAARQTAVDLANAAAAQRRQEAIYAGAQTGADRALTAATTTEQLRQRADEARVQQELNAQQLRQGGQLGALGAAQGAIGTQAGTAGARLAADTAAYTADKAEAMAQEGENRQMGLGLGTALGTAVGGPLGGTIGGAAGASLFSDERKKDDIEPIPDSAAMRLADAYKRMASTYEMKGGDGSTTAGVMAQDLQKDPLGRKFVGRSDDGMLTVDYNGLNAAVLKGLAAKMDAQTQRTTKARRA